MGFHFAEEDFKKSKSGYLLKNIGLLTISNFSTKILTFFLVPLYTNILTTGEYGTFDLVSTTVSLLIPIVTADVVDATLRFAMEHNQPKSNVFIVSLKYYLMGALITAIAIVLNCHLYFSPILAENSVYIMLLYLSMSLGGIMAAFSRGIGKVREAAVSGVMSSALTIALNILFLIPLKMGIVGYFWATILGAFSQSIYLAFAISIKKYRKVHGHYKNLEREMLRFSRPLIINNISWWINNASDRYVVTYFCGVEENGIYSIGYKIPTILSVFQSIFQQAWLLSAVHDFNAEDEGNFFSKTYALYNFSMVFLCSLLIWADKILAKILYANGFYAAWRYVPFLTFGFVYVAMANYIGGIFQAVKKPEMIAYSTLCGAILNIVLNIVLTQKIGAMGAAAATCFSYYIVWQVRLFSVSKYIKLHISILRDYIVYVLLLLQSICCIKMGGILCYAIQTMILLLIVLLNTNEIIDARERIFIKLREKRGNVKRK